MNDPHVKSLFYRIKHHDNVDYANAPSIEHFEPGFSIRIENGQAVVRFTEHHATAEAARASVEPFLRAWEMMAALEVGPGEWQFVYDHADVVDRNPTPGVINAVVLESISIFATHSVHIVRASYPQPPAGLACDDATVDLMFKRYCMQREGRTTLPDAGYYCLTILERAAGDRKKASKLFEIDIMVLSTLGALTANKGGSEARKAVAAQVEYTPAERDWLTKIIPLIIRRAAEAAFDSGASRPQITMADLPRLP